MNIIGFLKIFHLVKEKGFTLVPLRIFFNDKNLVKMEIGLARGKKLHDKRDSMRERDDRRQMARAVGRRQKGME